MPRLLTSWLWLPLALLAALALATVVPARAQAQDDAGTDAAVDDGGDDDGDATDDAATNADDESAPPDHAAGEDEDVGVVEDTDGDNDNDNEPATGTLTVVEDDTGKRLVLVYVIFWVLIAIFAGRVVWQLVKAVERLGGKVTFDDATPPLTVAPDDDPDNPFRGRA